MDWETLARYLAGESSPAEVERVSGWLATHQADAELVAALDRALTARALSAVAARASNAIDVEGALRAVTARRDMPAPPAQPTKPVRPMIPLRRRPAAAWRAAGLLAAAAVIVVAARAVLQRNAHEGVGAPAVARRLYSTGVGRRDSLRLADGSRVILGPSTAIVVPTDFGSTAREVSLHGEAYFDVVHDTTRPFSVRAQGVTIRDVGTAFSVHSDGVARVRVAVTAGAVSVRAASHGDSATLLRAGDLGIVQADGTVRVERDANQARDLAWMRGELVFRDASMVEIAADVRRWYGVVLLVADSAAAHGHLNMSFKGESADRVLQSIATALGGEIERRGDTAVVREATRGARRQ